MSQTVRALLGLVVLGAAQLVAPPHSAAALTLPASFQLVDHPTGQTPYNLTNFAWLDGGGLLATGKDGTVTYAPPSGTPRVLVTVPTVRAIGDHGLLGLALANDYPTTGRVYLTYDKGDALGTGVGMVEEWTASPPSDPVSFVRSRVLIDGATTSPPLSQDGRTHAIDSVVVAPDGTLFVSIGDDAANNGDLRTLRAQDLDLPHGKLLRVTPEGRGVPSNPFYSAAAPGSWRSMVYASGFRNPFRFSLDPRSGRPYVGDVGWNSVEEVDVVQPGANAGWPCYEGTQRTTFAAQPVCQALYAAGSALMPLVTYPHTQGTATSAAIVGGMHYTGAAYPSQYRDSWFFGDYSRTKIWTLATDAAGRLTRMPEPNGFALDVGAPVAFQPGPNGDVTYADLVTGKVRRLVYLPGNRPPSARFTHTVDPLTRSVRFDAAESDDLDGDELAFEWDFGDGTAGTGRSAEHTYASGSPVEVTLTVRDQVGGASTLTTEVHPANHTPQLDVLPPATGTFAVGDVVKLSATAIDAEDGPLSVSWDTALLHCSGAGSCHRHPDGTDSGASYSRTFTDHGADTSMLVTARVQDSTGTSVSRTFEAVPRLRTVSVDSPVPVTINGVVTAASQVVAGSTVQLGAPVNSTYWRFQGWSDGGAAAHALTMPDADRALAASYVTAIALRHADLGGADSRLGDPTGLEHDVAGGRSRAYTGGRLYWSPAAGAREVRGEILARYLATGGPVAHGLPTSDELGVPGGRASYFTQARIYYSPSTGARLLRGSVLARYLAAGGPALVGLPRTEEVAVPGGAYVHLTGGRSIFWSPRNGAHLLQGPIARKYAARGYQRSCLGFPTTERFRVGRTLRTRFTGGVIIHRPRTGATRVRC